MCVKTWKPAYPEHDKSENTNESEQIFSNVNLV